MLLVVLAGCGGGADDSAPVAPAPATTTDPSADLADPAPGTGVAALGTDVLDLADVTCTDGPAPDDTAEATREAQVTATGDLDGDVVEVEVVRFRSDTGAGDPVVTETARIGVGEGDAARGLEAKRTTAGPGGTWLDLADPEADAPLIERRGDAVDVRGTFGPEAARAGDEGLVEGRIRLHCPA